MLRIWFCLIVVLITACSSPSRYAQRHDTMPTRLPEDISFADAKPEYHAYNPANLRPYTVLGKHYRPMQTAKGYSAKGKASWYGKKFHGYKTANGEVYDMYQLSAAHKTLPLPAFVRVTNLDNGRQAIVRVNDRGPFHPDRIIDLSYAAALKLGMLSSGTARVKLDAMHVTQSGELYVGDQGIVPKQPLSPVAQASTFIQVAAMRDKNKANELATGLASLYQLPSVTLQENQIFRLRLGPVPAETDIQQLVKELHQQGFEGAFPIRVAD